VLFIHCRLIIILLSYFCPNPNPTKVCPHTRFITHKSSRPSPIPIQLSFGSISGILNQVPKQKVLSTVTLTLVDSLLLSMALVSAQVFHSVRAVRNGAIHLLGVNHMQPGVLYAMVFTNLSIIGKNYSAMKRMIS